MAGRRVDIAVVGGGFYGCALALFFRSVSSSVAVVEAADGLFEGASRVNQARLHGGFHYPRSFLTAMRCRVLQERFARDFPEAVVADFDMLYAVAARGSKVSAGRFLRMFESVDAPISPAGARHRSLFSRDLVESVFLCKEFAFDWRILRDRIAGRLEACRVDVRLATTVERLAVGTDGIRLLLDSGDVLEARYVFNVTYANINALLLRSGLRPLPLKHELAEIALVEPPAELAGTAITVMDGPFFSTMPYPSEDLYSLTHVRYTPHYAWVDDKAGESPCRVAQGLPRETRWRHMMLDARRYVPCLAQMRHRESLFGVKTVLTANERDDGRPILLSSHESVPRLYSVMGAKIDNIYDLFDVLPTLHAEWRGMDARCLHDREAVGA